MFLLSADSESIMMRANLTHNFTVWADFPGCQLASPISRGFRSSSKTSWTSSELGNRQTSDRASHRAAAAWAAWAAMAWHSGACQLVHTLIVDAANLASVCNILCNMNTFIQEDLSVLELFYLQHQVKERRTSVREKWTKNTKVKRTLNIWEQNTSNTYNLISIRNHSSYWSVSCSADKVQEFENICYDNAGWTWKNNFVRVLQHSPIFGRPPHSN